MPLRHLNRYLFILCFSWLGLVMRVDKNLKGERVRDIEKWRERNIEGEGEERGRESERE